MRIEKEKISRGNLISSIDFLTIMTYNTIKRTALRLASNFGCHQMVVITYDKNLVWLTRSVSQCWWAKRFWWDRVLVGLPLAKSWVSVAPPNFWNGFQWQRSLLSLPNWRIDVDSLLLVWASLVQLWRDSHLLLTDKRGAIEIIVTFVSTTREQSIQSAAEIFEMISCEMKLAWSFQKLIKSSPYSSGLIAELRCERIIPK